MFSWILQSILVSPKINNIGFGAQGYVRKSRNHEHEGFEASPISESKNNKFKLNRVIGRQGLMSRLPKGRPVIWHGSLSFCRKWLQCWTSSICCCQYTINAINLAMPLIIYLMTGNGYANSDNNIHNHFRIFIFRLPLLPPSS